MSKKGFGIGVKICSLIAAAMLVLSVVLIVYSYLVHRQKVDDYYGENASRLALSLANQTDGDFIRELRELVDEEDFKQVREKAVETGDWTLVDDYLAKKGIKEKYDSLLASYEGFLKDMNVKYLYIHSIEGPISVYLVSATGGLEGLGFIGDNAEEFAMYSTNVHIDPAVSNMDNEWVCSAYEPIFDSNGNAVSTVGVDIDMNQVVGDRLHFLYRMVICGIVITLIFVALGILTIRKVAVMPIEALSRGTKSFTNEETGYSRESVISLDINSRDELEELYTDIRSMQVKILDYIENITRITAEKERIGAELNVATQIQADMLPRIFPPFPERTEFDLYATMSPAKEVGGDFYDFFLIDNDHLGLVIADVSGKGVPAALFMVIAKTLIKNRAQLSNSPAEVLSYANDQLCEGNEAELFVTVWFAMIEISTGKGLAANAGHEHPAISRNGGEWELVKYRHSPAVATMQGMKFKEHEFEIHPGDRLFVYTDGVTEATNSQNELFGEERLVQALNKEKVDTPEKLLKNVREDIDTFVGDAPQFDDITMLGIYWKA
ncbi:MULTISPECIES: PP2C family protein-serine/threonine phosphatase [unclassified Butyrivibrio]|uniref:PP2C family protein-serine/threonine phosphatase n=1 Tax=unclassified Butyrivibrio TaxID=2639466 RepID=UPI00040326EE|nr:MULTISPECIES: PP2C family protein-serine/threonine phosphatase [unclassified Butyrivibrio]